MALHISACTFRTTKDGEWLDGAAILKEQGVYDVVTFIMPNGKAYKANNVWDYKLLPYRGALTIA